MKKTKWFELVALLIVSYGFQACDLTRECLDCANPPELIALKIVDANENNLITSGIYKRDSLKLYYLDGVLKKGVSFGFTSDSERPDIIVSSEMSGRCINNKIEFFLYLNRFDTDTLILEIQEHSDGCCTSYPIKSFEINGKPAVRSIYDYTFLIRKTADK